MMCPQFQIELCPGKGKAISSKRPSNRHPPYNIKRRCPPSPARNQGRRTPRIADAPPAEAIWPRSRETARFYRFGWHKPPGDQREDRPHPRRRCAAQHLSSIRRVAGIAAAWELAEAAAGQAQLAFQLGDGHAGPGLVGVQTRLGRRSGNRRGDESGDQKKGGGFMSFPLLGARFQPWAVSARVTVQSFFAAIAG